MFAQETVTRLTMVTERTEETAPGALDAWGTAEGYYIAKEVPNFLVAAVENVAAGAMSTVGLATGAELGSERLAGPPERREANLNTRDSVVTQSPASAADQIAAVTQIPEGADPSSAYGMGTTEADREAVDNAGLGAGQSDSQLHPRELVQDDSPPAGTIGTSSITPPEREPSVVHILPPPPKRTSTGVGAGASGSLDSDENAGHSRTPVVVPPPVSRRTVPPVLPEYQPNRYLDPAEAVQRRAQMRAEERRRRIEAWKWMGYSPSRPPVSATPFTEGSNRRPAVIIVPYVVHHRD